MRKTVLAIFIFVFFTKSVYSADPSNNSVVRILSIDSGGIRGLVALSALAKIEEELKAPISQIFDMVAGSSTGTIIALALTTPDEFGKPKYSAQQIFESYRDLGHSVFKRKLMQKIKTLGGLIAPKYQNHEIKKSLELLFGKTKISDAIIPTLTTGYNLASESGMEFFSLEAQEHPDDSDCLMLDVALASSAAPTYFAPVMVRYKNYTVNNVIDGGMYAYNPALLAYAQAKKSFSNAKNFEVYSIGTGKNRTEKLYHNIKKRGLLKWARPISSHLLNANSIATDSVLNKLLNSPQKQSYFRLDLSGVMLFNNLGNLDDVDKTSMQNLHQACHHMTSSTKLGEIIERLKQSR